jgi:ectoine hydroxylase-related dioxygenase (phytanoyl-CoA dioxygenase family)
MKLASAAKQGLLEQGYFVLRGHLDPALVASAAAGPVNPQLREEDGELRIEGLSVQEMVDPRGRPELMELLGTVLPFAQDVLGEAVEDLLFRIVRWPSGAPGVGLHVDMVPDPTMPWPSMDLSMSIPFTSAREAADGAYFVCPGSHRALLRHLAEQSDPTLAIWGVVAGPRRLFKSDPPFELAAETVVPLEPGDLLITHPALAHGVYPNASGRERSTAIINLHGSLSRTALERITSAGSRMQA